MSTQTGTSTVVSSMVSGLGIFDDPEAIYTQEVATLQRPGVLNRILATAGSTFAAAWYLARGNGGLGSYSRGYLTTAALAVMSAGLGINVGMYLGNSQLDAVGAAGIYFALNTAAANMGYIDEPSALPYEVAAALASGLAIDFYQRNNTNVPCQCPGTGSGTGSQN
jgi:hypothetical protein